MRYDNIEEMKKKADEGELDAIVQLGISYLYGYGVEKDYEEAFVRLQDAAMRNDPEAQLHLGKMYENGWGITQDKWTALSLYRLSYRMKGSNARKAFSDLIDELADEIPITGRLTITNDFKITCCCEKFRENIRMGKFLPYEDEDESNFYITNLNRNTKMHDCPFCGASVEHL